MTLVDSCFPRRLAKSGIEPCFIS